MKESLCNFRRRDCVLKPVSFFLNYNRHIQNIASISLYIEVRIEKLYRTLGTKLTFMPLLLLLLGSVTNKIFMKFYKVFVTR